jgi:hypothetical protein
LRRINLRKSEGVFLTYGRLCTDSSYLLSFLSNKMPLKIGIDVGGVLSIHKTDVGDGEHENTGIDMPGAIDSVRSLAAAGHSLYVVSFCGRRRAIETRDALVACGLADCFTAMYFVKKVTQKKNVCAALGLDALIDDRSDILRSVTCGTHRVKFDGPPIDCAPSYHCADWAAVMALLPTLLPAPVEATGASLDPNLNKLD